MKAVLKYGALSIFLALGMSSHAWADPGNGNGIGQNHGKGNPHEAPEIDGSLMLGAVTLLGGTLTVVRSRRAR